MMSKETLSSCRNLHDDGLTQTVQCTCCKLLTNIVEVIFKERSEIRALEQGRGLLAKILSTSVSKLSVIRKSLPTFMIPSMLQTSPIVHHFLCMLLEILVSERLGDSVFRTNQTGKHIAALHRD